MDWQGWIDRLEAIEREHPHKRIVAANIPGGLPSAGWNVENNQYRAGIPLGGKIEHLRAGVFASYPVTDGAFVVRFNDGTQI